MPFYFLQRISLLLLTLSLSCYFSLPPYAAELRWKTDTTALWGPKEETLSTALEQFFQKHLNSSEVVKIHPALSQTLLSRHVSTRASSAQSLLEWIKTEYQLELLKVKNTWHILPRAELWKHSLYEKWINTPISILEVLKEMSLQGKVPIIMNEAKLASIMLEKSILPLPISDVLHHLAKRFQLHLTYEDRSHTLYLEHTSEWSLESAHLIHIDQQKLHPILQQQQQHAPEFASLKLSYPNPQMIVIQGRSSLVQSFKKLIQELDHSYASDSRGEGNPKNIITKRVALKYLSVTDRTIQSEGQSLLLPGIEERLRAFYEKLQTDNTPSADEPSVEIISDILSNAILLRGPVEPVRLLQELLEEWDQPQALIKIEAHIFETTEQASRSLGTEFSATGLSAKGLATDLLPGNFEASATLGSLNPTQTFQVDLLLRAMEQQGQGRVLSRPTVVTTNNTEAEMNNGQIIHVRLHGGSKTASRLKEIKTGVILRVTPRLIPDTATFHHKIRLNVFAETSTPLMTQMIDGIPQINLQRAESQVVVPNGKPFLLGGLVKNIQSESDQGVPLLKDIPILGYLFQYEKYQKRFSHILVFVTPTLLDVGAYNPLPDAETMKPLPTTPLGESL